MRRRVVVYIIIFQIFLISALLLRIYKNKYAVLGTDASVNPTERVTQIFPKVDGLKYFHEPKPNSVSITHLAWENTNGPKNPTYRINADGLNQITNFEVDKPKNVFRIVALGDSFTFGQNVNTEDNYPSQLQNLFDKECKNKFQVLNIGVPGYDIKYTVERYRIRGKKYNPDLVLWFIIGDDLRRIDELFIPQISKIKEEREGIGEDKINYDTGNYYKAWKKAKNNIVSELGGERKVLDLQYGYMKELNKYFDKSLIIFTQPKTIDMYKSFLNNFVTSRPNSWFYDGIPDIYSIKGRSLPDSHPSPLGYKLIAENIFNYLTKNKLILCN